MTQNTQNRRNLTGMAGNRHKPILFLAKKRRRIIQSGPDLVERMQRTRILARAALARDSVPQLVALGKPRFNTVLWPRSMDSGFVAAAITRVNRDALAQTLENQRLFGTQKAVEGRVESLQAARQRAHKVRVWRVDVLDAQTRLPIVMRGLCLRDARRGEARVGPAGCAVAVEFSPVALFFWFHLSVFTFSIAHTEGGEREREKGTYVPGRSPVVRLSSVMPPFAMPAHKEYLVLNTLPDAQRVQTLDFTIESLPLGQRGNGPRRISRVGAVNKTEIDRSLQVSLAINNHHYY